MRHANPGRWNQLLIIALLGVWGTPGCTSDAANNTALIQTPPDQIPTSPDQMPTSPASMMQTPDGAVSDAQVGATTDAAVAMMPQPDAAISSMSDNMVAASAAALEALREHLAGGDTSLDSLTQAPFSDVALTAADSDTAQGLLWDNLADSIRQARADEHAAKQIEINGVVLRYETVLLGDEPPGGRDLFISMHGGGSGPASQNDEQWSNQIALATSYNPKDAIWVAPRAPTDDWNMWFKDHIDGLFDRLITNMIVFEGINPNRVYLNGYSAGGDGVYGLSPRTADRWAGAGMSAGHPNGVSVDNLRNVAFALHVGGDDTAFDRNLVAQEYIDRFLELGAADPGGYPFQGMVHPGLPHWMNLEDAVSIPFMQGYTRSATPDRVVWEQHEVTHTRSYWLAVDSTDAVQGNRVVARYDGQTITLEEVAGLGALRIRVSDAMMNLNTSIKVVRDGNPLFEGVIPRTIATLATTLYEQEDPALVYPAELMVTF